MATTSDDVAEKLDSEARNTAGSRVSSGARNDDAGAASPRSIEQVFPQPACLRSGQEPEALQQQDARAVDEIRASAGSVIAAIRKAVKNLRKCADYRLTKTIG